jgi:ABC-type oligopeptide transport system ATPase subunit
MTEKKKWKFSESEESTSSSSQDSSSSDASQLLPVRDLLSILIVGKSCSGKTFLTKSLMDRFVPKKGRIYVVNDRSRRPPYKKIGWNKLNRVRNCAVVVEDLISARPTEFELLQRLLNKRMHHNRVSPVVVICHSLLRNNVYGLVPYFSLIYLSAVQSNIASFKRLLSYYFEKSEHDALLEKFTKCRERYAHFMFDVEAHTITLTRAEDHVIDEEEQRRLDAKKRKLEAPLIKQMEAQESAKKYLSKMPYNGSLALNLFDLIYPHLPEDNFNRRDLTVSVFSRGAETVVSIIDYIHALLDNYGEEEEEDPDIMKFHKYLRTKKRMTLPKTYILNKAYKN